MKMHDTLSTNVMRAGALRDLLVQIVTAVALEEDEVLKLMQERLSWGNNRSHSWCHGLVDCIIKQRVTTIKPAVCSEQKPG